MLFLKGHYCEAHVNAGETEKEHLKSRTGL